MRKSARLWIKQEKRIIQLLYKKGFIPNYVKIDELYWASYHRTNKQYKSKYSKYKSSEYLPEVHYATSDYWGECDEHSLTCDIQNYLYWENALPSDLDSGEYPESKFKCKSRRGFIKYLKSLKTIHSDNKIKTVISKANLNE